MSAMSPPASPEPVSRAARLDRVLADLLAQTREIEAAAVVSFDGLPMASALPAAMDEDRVAAMSAALLSLGERAAVGLGRGELSQIYIEGSQGTVFLVSAQDEGVLVAVTAPGAKVGMMLYEVRLAAARVADVLTDDQPAPEPEPYAAPEAAVPVQTAPAQPVATQPVAPVVHAEPEPAPVAPSVDPYAGSYGDYSGGYSSTYEPLHAAEPAAADEPNHEPQHESQPVAEATQNGWGSNYGSLPPEQAPWS